MQLREPQAGDAAGMHRIVEESPALDKNSLYSYLLLCEHFRKTCLVAEENGEIAAFVTGYVPPQSPDTVFVWQIAVRSEFQRQGLAMRLLQTLLENAADREIRYVEATITPDNQASRRLFQSLAEHHATALQESVLFSKAHFGDSGHGEEHLLRIGPLNYTRNHEKLATA